VFIYIVNPKIYSYNDQFILQLLIKRTFIIYVYSYIQYTKYLKKKKNEGHG